MAAVRILVDEAAVPRFAPHVRFREDKVRGCWVVLAPERMYLPDEIGTAVLHLCEGGRSLAEIIDRLAAEYDAPRGEVAEDVLAMVQDLADKGVLTA